MTLRGLLSGLNVRSVTGDVNSEVLGRDYDSRRVTEGDLFFAIRGTTMDGNRFVPKALEQGAACIVSALTRPSATLSQRERVVSWVQVDDERAAMALIAANFYSHPTKDL